MIRFLITALDTTDNKQKHFVYIAENKTEAAKEIKALGFTNIVAYSEKSDKIKEIDAYLKSINK